MAAAPAAHAGPAGDKTVEIAAKVLKLNREAMELYDSLDFELAKRTLLEALDLGEAAGLGEHTVMVRTHANLGIVYGVGLKDEKHALKELRHALELRPDFKLSKDLASPEAMRLLARARDPKDAAPTVAADDGERERAKGTLPPVALKCPTAADVQAGDEITLRCVTSPELRPASVVLFYKRSGGDGFTSVPMTVSTGDSDERRATWVARIPGDEVNGRWLPFYFEARDRRGGALAMSGRDDSPSIITVRGGVDGGDEATARKARAEDQESALGDDGQARKKGFAPGANRFWLGLGVGSGGGYAKGNGVEAYRQYVRSFQPGFASEGLAHAVPEIGYFVTPTFALSLQGRNQYIPRDNHYTAGGANAVLARALFFAGEGHARFYGALAAGGGEGFRLVVKAATMEGDVVHDTVKGGPVLAGAGGGFSYAFGDTWSWMIETNLLAGFPVFSTVLDVNTGLRAGF